VTLKLYFDSGGTQEITAGNRDTVTANVIKGLTYRNERLLYMKATNANEYLDITIQDLDGDAQVFVEYAFDDGGVPGPYALTINPPDGVYTTSLAVWRRFTALAVTANIMRTDIDHRVTAGEYLP
jgi:hypothetical protein